MSCTATVEFLQEQLEKSNYGENRLHFSAYFTTTTAATTSLAADGGRREVEERATIPPRCVACGLLISQHPREEKKNQREDVVAVGVVCEDITLREKEAVTVGPLPLSTSPQKEVKLANIKTEPERLQPTCSFCEAHKLTDERDYLEMLKNNANNPKRRTLEGLFRPSQKVQCPDETPLVMLPISFEDNSRLFHVAEFVPYDYPRITCDECLTEFPAPRRNTCSTSAFFAKYPRLQCYTCKYCSRKVCSDCVRSNLHRRAQSRFSSLSPEWKTDLYSCCESPGHAFGAVLCYWCVFPSPYCLTPTTLSMAPNFTLSRFESNNFALKECTCTAQIIMALSVANSLLLWGFAMLSDLFFFSSVFLCLNKTELELKRRFGLPGHSDCEKIFCRYCVFVRMVRELEARGFLQTNCHHASCCDKTDFEEYAARFPPLHPHAVTKALGGGGGEEEQHNRQTC